MNTYQKTNSDNINILTSQGVKEINGQYVLDKVSFSNQKIKSKAKLEEESTKVKNEIADDV